MGFSNMLDNFGPMPERDDAADCYYCWRKCRKAQMGQPSKCPACKEMIEQASKFPLGGPK